MNVNFQYDLTPDEARDMAFAERCRGNMTRAQEYERMALKAIPTVRNRFPDLFVGRPRPRFLAEDERVHTARNPICEDKTCPCWPPLLADNAWKLDGNYRAPAMLIGQDEAAQMNTFYSGIDA